MLASGTGNLRTHRIAMVQATQSRQRSNRASAPWVDSNWTTGWRVLRQPQMRSILMVIAYVFRYKAFQMSLVEDDHVIQQVPAAASHPTLRHTVLPRTVIRRTDGRASQFSDGRHHVPSGLSVVVEQQEFGRLRVGPRFSHPLRSMAQWDCALCECAEFCVGLAVGYDYGRD